MRGYGPGRFSFNVRGGRCEACDGDGVKKIEMHFLPDVYGSCQSGSCVRNLSVDQQLVVSQE